MPNRILKESVKYSQQIDDLTYFEEVVFYRLIVSADDYGCIDGRPIVLKNELFPTKDNVTKKAISDAVDKLIRAGLVERYVVGESPYIHLLTWNKHQRLRNSKHKYPTPDEASKIDTCDNLPQIAATCRKSPQLAARAGAESESESEYESEYIYPPTPHRGAGQKNVTDLAVENSDLDPTLKEAARKWIKYKLERRESYKETGLNSLLTQIRRKADEYGASAVIDCIDDCITSGYKGIIWDKLKRGSSPGRPEEDVNAHMLKIINGGT